MPTCVLHGTNQSARTYPLIPYIHMNLSERGTYESVALNLWVLFAMLVVCVISSPSETTAEFTLISPVRPSMMLSALKSTTVPFAEASCPCRVVMEAWRA